MANFHPFDFLSADGIHRCQGYLWLPENCPPKGVVQLIHGVAEHMGRYEDFARFLSGQGFAVCGADLLGHGQTALADHSLGFFARRNGWALVTADVYALRCRMGEQFPGLPHVLLGHSMGSFLARSYLCRYPSTVDAAILSGTGQESALLVAGGRLLAALIAALRGAAYPSPLLHALSLGSYNRAFAPNRTRADWISRDEEAVDRYLADPLCAFVPTVSLYRDMLSGLRDIARRSLLARMDPDTPILLFSGDRDPVGGFGAGVRKVHRLLKQAGVRDTQLRLYPGGRHEMLHEYNREEVYVEVLNWLNAHIAPTPLH